MKKYLFYSMMVAIALCTTACNKNKSDVEDKTQESNPYSYLRISDVEIYYEKTISEAEDILYTNGYKGGFLSEDEYKYAKGNDTICLYVYDEDIVRIINYTSAIKVNLEEAKGWLLHPTETYQGKYPLKFDYCYKYPGESIIEDFKIYENNINLLSSKDGIEAFWTWVNNDSTRLVIGWLSYNVGETEETNVMLWYGDGGIKKVEASSKAAFDYEVEDFTVTFLNLSANANTYVWDFGDGQTSNEVNPVHTYSEDGDYTVVLTAKGEGGESKYSETITLKTTLIKIDGNMGDWDAALAKGQAVSTQLQDGVEYEMTSIKKFAALMDEDYIYFMLAFDPTNVMPLDMFIGCSGERVDKNPCSNYWNPMYCDYLIEFGKGETFTFDPDQMDWYDWNYSTQFLFDKEIGGWAFSQVAQNIVTLSDRVIIDGVTYVEGKMARAAFQMKAAYIYISCCTSDDDWSGSGMAPAAPLDAESGSPVYQPQLMVEQTK